MSELMVGGAFGTTPGAVSGAAVHRRALELLGKDSYTQEEYLAACNAATAEGADRLAGLEDAGTIVGERHYRRSDGTLVGESELPTSAAAREERYWEEPDPVFGQDLHEKALAILGRDNYSAAEYVAAISQAERDLNVVYRQKTRDKGVA